MNGKQRNEELRKIFQDMPPSIPLMQRYEIIAALTMTTPNSVRHWISHKDIRYIPAIKLNAVKDAARKYGASLQLKVGRRVARPVQS